MYDFFFCFCCHGAHFEKPKQTLIPVGYILNVIQWNTEMGRQSVQNVVDSFSERIFPGLSQIPQEFSFVSGQSDIGK